MIYVDAPTWQKGPRARKTYAHMVANDLWELHEFAKTIGVKRHFFHRGDKPHYDITAEQHAIAVQNGAVEVSSREIVRLAVLLKPAELGPLSDAIRQFALERRGT